MLSASGGVLCTGDFTRPGSPSQSASSYLSKDGSLVCWYGEEASLFNTVAPLASVATFLYPEPRYLLDIVQCCRLAVPEFFVDGLVSAFLRSDREYFLTLSFQCNFFLHFHSPSQ